MTQSKQPSSRGTTGDETTPVLVVGGGLSGLSTALFLSWHGIRPLLVERHADLLVHPRARGFTQRTVELFRQVGLEPTIREACFADGEVFRWVPIRAETLAGEHELVEEPDEAEAMAPLSPSPFGPIDQDKLEVLLRSKAVELGADIRFSTELTSFVEDETGVTAVLKDLQTGTERTVRTSYLVAADGWDSRIREQLGIDLDGPGQFFCVVTVMIEADLRPALRGRPVNIAYLQQPRPGTILLAHDEDGKRWVFGTGYAPAYGETVADFTEERCIELVQVASGLPDIQVTIRPQIPNTDLKVLNFPIGAQVARRYSAGRVFLVGDAAHIVPPSGGFGANTGIQDAHNLAWKLAAVLRGEAGPTLLETYHDERHPVGLLTMEQALARWGTRIREDTSGGGPDLLDYAAVAFGYRYRSTAVIGATDDSRSVVSPTELNGQPGTRAPHVWLERGGEPLSTIDVFGRQFVLLTGPDGDDWIDAARSVPGIQIDAYRVGEGGDILDPQGSWATAYGVSSGGVVLVRPDGFVAWRAEHASTEPAQTLLTVVSQLLGQQAPAASIGR